MNSHPISETLGWHTCKTLEGTAFYNKENKDSAVGPNLGNICSYIPVAGFILGFFRVHAVYKNEARWNSGTRVVQAIRGVCEILCCGLLFFVIDLIVSIGRHLCRCKV